MKIYLVGGAIRDRLLGLSLSDRDWVIINSNYSKMLQLNFYKVGKNFPVFFVTVRDSNIPIFKNLFDNGSISISFSEQPLSLNALSRVSWLGFIVHVSSRIMRLHLLPCLC